MPQLTFNGTRIQFEGNTLTSPNIYDDWFLPSQDELVQIKNQLHDFGIGDFTNSIYWSSTENTATEAVYFAFSGSGSAIPKGQLEKIRACRSFNAPISTYSLRDVGPAGGLIFIVDGTIYYEAAPYDQEQNIWSNITNVLIGTTSVSIGTGQSNTLAIINQSGHFTSAAKICNDLVITNY